MFFFTKKLFSIYEIQLNYQKEFVTIVSIKTDTYTHTTNKSENVQF